MPKLSPQGRALASPKVRAVSPPKVRTVAAPKVQALADPGCIEIRGARQNNLKGIDLDLPLGKLNVITGPSGSGKSSLAFDTIYAEGQRRYVETFSPYTRQFLDRMDKPLVDAIRGIPPAIAIQQDNQVRSTRSTVGTMTEINDYLKLLLPRIVEASCPVCGGVVRPETPASIVADVERELAGQTVLVTFAVPVPAKTEPAEFFQFLRQQGYQRVLLGGEPRRIDELGDWQKLPALVPVVQDRVTIGPESTARLREAVEVALRFGKDQVRFIAGEREHPYSLGWHCAQCDHEITPPSAGLFSFNHPIGACPKCRGFGRTIEVELERAIPDRSLSIADGVVKPFQTENGQQCQKDLLRAAALKEVRVDVPFAELPEADQRWVLAGEQSAGTTVGELAETGRWYGVRGFFEWLETKTYKMHVRVLLSRYRAYTTCRDCHGGRFQPATLNFKVTTAGGAKKTLPELAALAVSELHRTFSAPAEVDETTAMLRAEVAVRLRYLDEVGLGYLSLDRATRSLSGGEIERVNLTTCLGGSLVNTLFVLDEPTVGLHPRDIGRLVRVMKGLRDRGNTLLVVEHEEAVIRAADHVIEIGPGRGAGGGELVYDGAVRGLEKRRGSLTGDYLSGRKSIPVPKTRRTPTRFITVEGATAHNLRDLDVRFPLDVFCCVTGVSGSGKSTLVHEVLHGNLLAQSGAAGAGEPGACRRVRGAEQIARVVMVDQSPLARTPRSSPAVYLGVFDGIREMFGMLPAARAQGLSAGAFSFNSGSGRCARCGGMGFDKIEMQFLSDVYVRCPECDGRRYQAHVLRIKLEGRSIHEVLEMTVAEAVPFFTNLGQPKIAGPLALLEEVGLGYLRLGHPLNVLSGGESQRLKLVSHLGPRAETGSLLILDEPTTGLHFDDVAVLVRVLRRIVEQGNSLIVIEHNLEVVKGADYVLDLGPEAGAAGGELVVAGTPEEVAACEESHTGRYLRALWRGEPVVEEARGAARVAEEPEWPARRPSPAIEIRGAREHNLKNIDVQIPRDQLVIVTGLSGSGKSTLAFDILFAEGQRRFLDSMSPYARQFVEQLEKPDVDSVTGLPPAVAIEQRITRGGGKSTVATVTEVYHFLRLLFAKVGVQHCPRCDLPVSKQSFAEALAKAEALARKGRIRVFAPLVKARKGFHAEVAKWALEHGFETLLVDGVPMPAAGFRKLERFKEHTIDVLVGERGSPARLTEILKRALEIGGGTARILDAKNRAHILSTERSCANCGTSFEELDPRLFSFNSPHGWCEACRGFGEIWEPTEDPRAESEVEKELNEERQFENVDEGETIPCEECAGSRLNPEARAVRVDGRRIQELTQLPVGEVLGAVKRLKFRGVGKIIARDIVPEIQQRLGFMAKVGLDYLSLNRSAKTLSGGESQRIRLAAQLGSNLRGVLYVLDEPTIGLHARDNEKLLDTLVALKDRGNSLVIVEHDEAAMRRADLIIDLGPRAGIHGGEVVTAGTLAEVQKNPRSATGRSLREPLQHPVRGARRALGDDVNWLRLRGASANNLQNVEVAFPLGRLSVITGISGSGKSSLMRRELLPAVTAALARKKKITKSLTKIEGAEFLEAIYEVDQSPLGKTSRSTPATYIKVWDEIRKLYAQLPTARMRGYTASRFSFNTEGGRCEACSGQGVIKVEMNFLPASLVPCSECHGLRYNPATLEVCFNGQSLGDVLALTIEQAAGFFASHPKIARPLSLLVETGLGYLKLGQPSPTLSGGEAQRLKLVSELTRGAGRLDQAKFRQMRTPKSILYLLEEPTIGLHMADVEELMKVLHRLVDEGSTVIVIEHHLSLIAEADYVIDIGPEAGPEGGRVVAAGTPEQVARSRTSRTAPFLREVLEPGRGQPQRSSRRRAVLV